VSVGTIGRVDAVTAGDAIKFYKDPDVSLMGMSLAEKPYRATTAFPREELYGMTAQIRWASASIPLARIMHQS
jgi:hypothetical protein